MTEAERIRLVDEAAGGEEPPPGFVRRRVDLPVRDEVLRLAADVPCRAVRLAEIVPLVYEATDRLMAIYLRDAREQSRTVYCRKGCGVCCNRYLIVLAPTEVDYLMETIESLPPGRRGEVRAWLSGAAALAEASGLHQRLDGLGPKDDPADVVAEWWLAQEMLKCPFPAGGLCTIYPHRFIACREHYSYVPPECCARREPSRMPAPISFRIGLRLAEERLTGRPAEWVALPLVKVSAERRAPQAGQTWPAAEVVEAVFAAFSETAADAQRLRGRAVVARPGWGEDGNPPR